MQEPRGRLKARQRLSASTGARFGLNLISAVSAQGEFRFMTVNGRVGATKFIDFLKRLIHNAERMIFLIVDGHPGHKARSVRRFVESVKDRLQLFLFPPYSPELNPDERVWNDLKNNAVDRKPIDSPKDLHKIVRSHMRLIQRSPDRVRSYFQNETTKYPA
jgi:transposase